MTHIGKMRSAEIKGLADVMRYLDSITGQTGLTFSGDAWGADGSLHITWDDNGHYVTDEDDES